MGEYVALASDSSWGSLLTQSSRDKGCYSKLEAGSRDGVLTCVCLCDWVITSNLLPPSGSLMGSQCSVGVSGLALLSCLCPTRDFYTLSLCLVWRN